VARAPAALRLVADRAARTLTAAGAPGRGDGIAVAVSGGADSLALLHALRTLSVRRGWRLAVATVDHGLRPDAAADAAFVADHAASLGLESHLLRVAPEELEARRGEGPEGTARAARYRALAEAAAKAGCRFVATGHTLDDQAETVLLQLLRGAGPDGLAAMAPRDGWLLRPLLAVRREQTRACCRALGLAWREDASNTDQRLLRNAVRLRGLPLLEELRPGAALTLARTAELARAEREWLDPLVSSTLDAVLDPRAAWAGLAPAGGGGLGLRAGALAGLPVALGRRVVRAACARAGCGSPAAETTDAVLALAGAGGPRAALRWPGGVARRDGDALVIGEGDDSANRSTKPARPAVLG
jgi:tRNA(Ile)-lysidine synthetase-like protein